MQRVLRALRDLPVLMVFRAPAWHSAPLTELSAEVVEVAGDEDFDSLG